MSKIHFRWYFWPFQIHTDLNFFLILDKMAAGGHFGCPKIVLAISDRYATFFLKFLDKMADGGHFGLDDNVSYRTRPRYLDE